MLYKIECWTTKKQDIHRMSISEIRRLSLMSSKTQKNRIKNKCTCQNLGVAPLGNKIRESPLMVRSCSIKINNCTIEKKCKSKAL